GRWRPTANPRGVQYPVETLAAAVREAERLAMPVAAHTLSADGVRNCVEAGVHHLIHARWYSADPAKGLEYDPSLAQRMADQGQWVDITIGLMLLGNEAIAAGAPPRSRHGAVASVAASDEEHLDTARDMRARRVRFATGLDMGMAHARFDASAANARAFVRWLGYSPWGAIRAATADSAEAL